jgi:hypothetical protein
MPKLSDLLRIAQALVRNPAALMRVVNEEEEFRSRCERMGFGQGLPQVDILDLFPDFDERVEPYSFLEGTSTTIDIALLTALARRVQNCRYLEIGTWRGESVANVAKHARECVSLSLSEREMRDLGWSDDFIRVHQFYSRGLPNVTHIGHNSRTFDFGSLGEGFDLVFVDGDHTYEGVRSDTNNAFRVLRNGTSVIVWHDYGATPETVRWDVLAGILDGCPPEQRRNLCHVSNTLCAVWLPQPVPTRSVRFPDPPNKTFAVSLSAKRV